MHKYSPNLNLLARYKRKTTRVNSCKQGRQNITMIAIFNLDWFSIIFLFFLLQMLTMVLLRNKRGNQSAKLPPGPPRLPIIGNLHQLGNLPHHSLHKISQKYGPIMFLKLGSTPTIIISSAKMAQEVMKTHDLDCCSRPLSPGPKRLSYNHLDVAFAPYSDYWREMRKLFIFELLSMKRVQSFGYVREAEVDKLITSLSEAFPNPINLNEKIFTLGDGIIGTVAFGKIYATKQFKHKAFQHVLDEAMNMLASFSAEDFFPTIGQFIDYLTGLKTRRERIFKELDAYFEMVLNQHLDPNRPQPEHEDFVDILVQLLKDQSFGLTKDHVKAILLDTFVGGIDTSAITMLWAMSELIKNPRVMKKVQIEIRNTVGKKAKVDGESVANLNYLKMVVKETFRLHPPATLLIPRETMRHCEIGGFDIFPQTRIMVNAWAIGRDPDSWENPKEFHPERFEDKDIDFKGAHFELVPFGAGRRICPGLAMGATNIEFTLANLLYCFDWELPCGMNREDISMEEEGGLTYHRKTPLNLIPIRYNSLE
ncbi:4-hydroxyphenylacetaldehyde oxime monooxygenase, putative [Theobroma cacao]|uniref:4-hydroxyphenylacetaldehyde oxime monooxygenase, putative n=1 Tax=Theobroma cacao TaxID=3641 RepID=A0A061DSE9_THECC|nr:4-hydroxyphenylacetaldehyde oxime monooxygenase, putative [Theobroma cacao]